MTTILRAFLGIALLGSLGLAATVNCTPQNNNVITNASLSNPTMFNCAGVSAAPGNVITSASVELFLSFQDAVGGTNHRLVATASELSGQIGGFVPVTSMVMTAINPAMDFIGMGATGAFGGSFTAGVGTVANLTSLSSFNVSVLTAPVFPYMDLPDNASISVAYTTTEAASGVPEPGTYALLGSGLGLLGIVKRLRK